ncbi:unnamed protein product [Ambrosiozyma monospora]|uniref:Unnamed protein product n=1 Tax=Ambrosiozyma monospora TaxID=43982 RepID=A0ACB5TDH8_AMBMO|nr:unnamed protein product [Ambrosiozyma monospora]
MTNENHDPKETSNQAPKGAPPASGTSIATGLLAQAIYLENIIPTPSNTPKTQAQEIALVMICLGPPLIANDPPTQKPAKMAFHASSLFLILLMEQS